MTIRAIDLFAGGGGTSTGLALACQELGQKVDLTAINHWDIALESHKANFPWATHIQENVQNVDIIGTFRERHIRVLDSTPECIHFSRAAGGRPRNEQLRVSPWYLFRYLELLYVDSVVVENVMEITKWGPLGPNGRPIRSREGETFEAWLHGFRSLNYNVDWRVLNAADYGAPTSRSRFFLIARKGNKPVVWPEPTHSRDGRNGLKKWRAAAEIIDWDNRGTSIIGRKKPLARKTIMRIIAGFRKHGPVEMEPFLYWMEHGGGIDSLDKPLRTITGAKGGAFALVVPSRPFILSQGSGGAPRSVDEPLPTTPADGAHALVQSAATFILPPRGFFGGNTAKSVDQPLGTLTQRGGGHVVEGVFISQYHGGAGGDNRSSSVNEPLPVVDTSNRHALVRAEPIIIPYYGSPGTKAQEIKRPLPTVTAKERFALAYPCIIRFNGTEDASSEDSRRAFRNSGHSPEAPLGAITARPRWGIAESFIVRFNGTDESHIQESAKSIREPIPTIVGSSGHLALVQSDIKEVEGWIGFDILFRMLEDYELAAATGFPKGYVLKGTKEQRIRQIGNAVQVDMAKALFRSILAPDSRQGRLSAA